MDSFEINKLVAAVIVIFLVVFGIGKISDIVFHVEKPNTSAYKVEVSTASSSQDSNANEKVDIAALFAMGDVDHGKKVWKKCSACHSIKKGGKNKIGPALYSVLGRNIAAISDYKYSKAIVSYGKSWTFEEMNGFLKKPATYIKGTKMAFAGLKKEKDRASIILFMNQNSENPLPLP
ncbi:MAG: c-type cytochrome [Candidatus Pelagibacter sp.]|tara:strand:- start:284 stop:814 length:531 start_codon:yes stop_codon:yes gene_type:complete